MQPNQHRAAGIPRRHERRNPGPDRENEIREYQGARLDPAIGPRDNSISGVQRVDIAKYTPTIGGLVDQKTVLTYDDVLAMEPDTRLITLHCVEGWDAAVLWEGVRLADIIDLAGAQSESYSKR